MLIWVLLGLGVLIMVAHAVFGHRMALVLVALWIVVAVVGWTTGMGVRQ